ncbi:MAG TPA: hypothetical protein VF876_10730 [Burkholderiales bacterium]
MKRSALRAACALVALSALGLQARHFAGAAEGGSAAPPAPLAAIAPGGDAARAGTQTAQADPQLPRRSNTASKRDVFAPHSWAPPPAAKPKAAPPPPPPPEPPAPTAPALTLVYLGQFDTAGAATVYYLAQGDRVFAVTAGETIDGVYRVLAPEGRSLALLYLPLNIKQLLPMGPPPS